MGAKVIGRVVDAAILLVGLAAVLAVFRGAAALLGGKAGETVWAVTTGGASPVTLVECAQRREPLARL